MKYYIGITDNKWFEFLAARKPDEVNFWRPSGPGTFRAIPIGAPFLFKLHSPLNFIVGGGFLVSHSNIPISLAWNAFGEKNGADSIDSVRGLIETYRRGKPTEHDPVIGCTILANPFFLERAEWIPSPSDWGRGIMTGKTYDTATVAGEGLWNEVQLRLQARTIQELPVLAGASLLADELTRYGAEFLSRARLGQGAFRVLVTDAYTRRCAITGERTLPTLEAAHIKPYAKSGPHQTANGLLLRSDLHKLFDLGYLSVTPDLAVEVSGKIREEFENGKDYYAFHGRKLTVVPSSSADRPASEFLDWHNRNVYLG